MKEIETSRISEKIEKLGENPIYHMSLSSSELFHSNFIEWLFNYVFNEAAKKQFIEFFFGDITPSEFNFGNLKLEREKLNTDISFKINGSRYVIENKFKSYPTKLQLDEYQKKAEKVTLLYFNLAEGDLTTFKDYNPKSYADFIEELKSSLYDSVENSNYNYIKVQYCEYVKSIIEIFKEFSEDSKDIYNFITKNKKFDSLEKIRLRDIFFKIKNQEFLIYLKDKLPEDFHFETNFKNKNSIVTIWQKADEKEENIGKLIDERIYEKAQAIKGIQIQGGQFRYFYILQEGIKVDDLRKKYLDCKNDESLDELEKNIKKWFTMVENPNINNNLFNNTGKEPFNKFDKFIYTYKKVENESFKEILNMIEKKYDLPETK